MPLRLTPLEALLARLNLLPVPLLDTPIGAGSAKVLVCACELGLFDVLAKEAMTLSCLAERLDCDAGGLQLLLGLLVSTGYLHMRQGHYSNTRLTRRWLLTSSPHSIAPYVLHSPDIVALWDHLPEVVRTGQMAVRMPYEEEDETPEAKALLARHYAGLASLATGLGSDIVAQIRLPRTATALLDVGGSHAAFSAMLCQRYPALHATIIDIPAGIEAGRRTARSQHLEERLHFLCTDFVRDDFASQLEGQFDCALYSHIAHLLQPEVNQAVLQKVARTLKPGGMLVFVDQVVDQEHNFQLGRLIIQFMALTMATVGGTCYPFATVKDWLEQLGMHTVRRHRLLMPGVTMITAIKV
ncbi:methyltransferase domain-containing protein [Ktedonobacteria bacterium brp13]|nr:methyltransferase domain-containing protein [Ktedonobacteria bacterium brp13]